MARPEGQWGRIQGVEDSHAKGNGFGPKRDKPGSDFCPMCSQVCIVVCGRNLHLLECPQVCLQMHNNSSDFKFLKVRRPTPNFQSSLSSSFFIIFPIPIFAVAIWCNEGVWDITTEVIIPAYSEPGQFYGMPGLDGQWWLLLIFPEKYPIRKC